MIDIYKLHKQTEKSAKKLGIKKASRTFEMLVIKKLKYYIAKEEQEIKIYAKALQDMKTSIILAKDYQNFLENFDEKMD
jgi:hypothetical protein